jgi:hypothetical protein
MPSKEPKTYEEIFEAVSQLELKEAVYTEVSTFLDRFLTTDTHTPEQGIASPVRPWEVVPEDMIHEVKDEVSQICDNIQAEIRKLKGLKLNGAPKRSTKSTKAKRKAPQRKRRKSSGSKKK